MGMIQIGKDYPTLKCDVCNGDCKEYSSTIISKEASKTWKIEIDKRICHNCICSIPETPEEKARIKKLKAKWDKENLKRMEEGRKRAKDPEWNKKLQDHLMSVMMDDCSKGE